MFKLSVAFLALAAGLVNAVPAAPLPSQDVANADGHVTPGLNAYKSNNTNELVALASPGVYLCVNALFTEPCVYLEGSVIIPGACYPFSSFFINALSSFGPDRGLKCYGYLNTNCTPAHPNLGPITYPGIDVPAQFVQDGVDYHDRINSIICWNS
ncbi:hypothetical protein AURDEDRAFT_127883 [Auricularia subglabra TFB-10046 SS5]|nr:hypothetical protein AURDEDRAFT_127883 [Auricularia subglabra TFB-10046 SS5]